MINGTRVAWLVYIIMVEFKFSVLLRAEGSSNNGLRSKFDGQWIRRALPGAAARLQLETVQERVPPSPVGILFWSLIFWTVLLHVDMFTVQERRAVRTMAVYDKYMYIGIIYTALVNVALKSH